MAADAQHDHAIVGDCVACDDGQMVEMVTTYGERRVLQLECQSCGAAGRIEYVRGEQNPWENPDVQEGIANATVAEIAWIDCPNCHGHGQVKDPLCDLRRAMHGREHPCPDCNASGAVPNVLNTEVA